MASPGESGTAIDEVPRQPSRSGVALVPFSSHDDRRGRLTVIEEGVDLPFACKRLYYFGPVPADTCRGDHAHAWSQTVLVPVVGSFDVEVHDGSHGSRFRLEDPSEGLLVPPRHWLRVSGFAPGSLCLVLSSHLHDDDDYFRDYAEFLRIVGGGC